nr:atherin-like [Aegilops tauschii subsp. strangulata]
MDLVRAHARPTTCCTLVARAPRPPPASTPEARSAVASPAAAPASTWPRRRSAGERAGTLALPPSFRCARRRLHVQPPCLARPPRPPAPCCRSPAHARPRLRSPPPAALFRPALVRPLAAGARARLYRVTWAGYSRTPGLRPVSPAPTPATPNTR